MDVRLSAEQQALQESVVSMMARLAPKGVSDLDDAERAAKIDAAVEAAGWRELRAAADGHGPLASAVEAAIVAEEMGRALADTSYLGPILAADLRRLAEAQPSVSRETVVLTADLASPAVGAAEGGLAIDCRDAASALAVRPGSEGHILIRVGVEPAAEPVDLTRSVARIAAGEEPIPSRRLGQEDLEGWTALGLAMTSADLVGVMRGVVELSTEYAASRKQYGAAIGSFQAVQHMLADAVVAMEGSRSVARYAAWAVDALPATDALGAGSLAKAYCARAARSVCETGIQVHGGIGNTWDCLAHVYLRRALLSIDVLGGVGANLERVLAQRGIGGSHGLQ